MKQKQSKPAAYFDVPSMNVQATASQFKQFRTEVADAIRAKKGTSESINPQDFAEEIASIETGGGGYNKEEALFDFFEVDLTSDLLYQDTTFNSYVYGYEQHTPWAMKVKGGGYVDIWLMSHKMPFLGHGEEPVALMFKCGKGDMETQSFLGALKPITASEFYDGDIVLY